jgi:glutaminyl-peptide cyclotransferase
VIVSMLSIFQKRSAGAALAILLLSISAGCVGKTSSTFTGETDFNLFKRQCEFGPRPPGTAAHEKTADFLHATLKQYADQVFEQKFTHEDKQPSRRFTGRNVIGVFGKNRSRWILLMAHWDTRPTADQEIDPQKRRKPILGANDGASGCAVLLELARMFHEQNPQVGVIIAFVDGEDYGPGPDEMFLGSLELAKNWRQVMQPVKGFHKFEYGVLLDMVGDKDLQIYKEAFSNGKAPKIVEKVWGAAKDLGYDTYFKPRQPNTGDMIQDDHLPMLAAGIDCIDVIDFDYAPWHTLDDTLDKCSPESLKIVGDVVAKVIYDEPSIEAKGATQ